MTWQKLDANTCSSNICTTTSTNCLQRHPHHQPRRHRSAEPTPLTNDDLTLPYEDEIDHDTALKNDKEDLLDYESPPPGDCDSSPHLKWKGEKHKEEKREKKKTKWPAKELSGARQSQPTAKKAREVERTIYRSRFGICARSSTRKTHNSLTPPTTASTTTTATKQHIHPHHRRGVSFCSTSQLFHNGGSTTAHGCQHPTRSPTVDTDQPTTTTTLLNSLIDSEN